MRTYPIDLHCYILNLLLCTWLFPIYDILLEYLSNVILLVSIQLMSFVNRQWNSSYLPSIMHSNSIIGWDTSIMYRRVSKYFMHMFLLRPWYNMLPGEVIYMYLWSFRSGNLLLWIRTPIDFYTTCILPFTCTCIF